MRKREALALNPGSRVRLRAGSVSALRLGGDGVYTVRYVGGTRYG